MAAYEGWQRHELGAPLLGVYESILQKLQKVTAENLTTFCGQVPNIDQVLTLELLKHLQATGATRRNNEEQQ